MERFDPWKEKIIEAAGYVESGDPLKDAIDESELAEIICILAEVLEEQ